MRRKKYFLVAFLVMAFCVWTIHSLTNRTGVINSMEEVKKLNVLYNVPFFETEGKLIFSEHRSSIPYHILVVFGEMKGNLSDWIYNKEIGQCEITGCFPEEEKKDENSITFSHFEDTEVYLPDCIAEIENDIIKCFKLRKGTDDKGESFYYMRLREQNAVLCEYYIESTKNQLIYSFENRKFILYIHAH